MPATSPFFMVGCVRSGTTLLRDILKSSPRLDCPEETHFYRWSHPFGTKGFDVQVDRPALMKKHRAIDGVPDKMFARVMSKSLSRRDLQDRYMSRFLKARDVKSRRWFDKSPQNIYGLPLLAHDYPDAKFIHIVRNPLNVVASLLLGKVVLAPTNAAAANYWNEATAIFNTCRPIIADRSYELHYEKLVTDPAAEMRKLMAFLGEDFDKLGFDFSQIHMERDQYLSVLSLEDIDVTEHICGKWAAHYGYDFETARDALQKEKAG